MRTRLHTLHLKSSDAQTGSTNDNAHFTTQGIGLGGTIKKGVVRVDYVTSASAAAAYSPGGIAYMVKIKSPSIPFVDKALRGGAANAVNKPDQTIDACLNQSYQTAAGNFYFHYKNNDTSRDGNTGREFEMYNTANPLNIVVTDISDDALVITNWRIGITFIEYLDDE